MASQREMPSPWRKSTWEALCLPQGSTESDSGVAPSAEGAVDALEVQVNWGVGCGYMSACRWEGEEK